MDSRSVGEISFAAKSEPAAALVRAVPKDRKCDEEAP
jgi:hypothetical protein